MIMLTARADMNEKLKALNIGVNDYMLKPFEEEKLSTSIQSLLNKFSKRITTAPAEEKEDNSSSLSETPGFNIHDQASLEKLETILQKEFSNAIGFQNSTSFAS